MANALNSFNTPNEKRLQVLYLAQKNYSNQEIAEITGYAVSTVISYQYKYKDDIDFAMRYFSTTAATTQKGNYCYWIRVYQNGEYLFDKIGTTQRNVKQRIYEILYRGWKDHKGDLTCDIIDVFDCGNLDCRGLEELIHGLFISKQYDYIPNDRFSQPLDSKAIYDIAKQFGYI